MTEVIHYIRIACAEVMHITPGISLERVEDMDWRELSRWRDAAVDVWKRVNGVNEDE